MNKEYLDALNEVLSAIKNQSKCLEEIKNQLSLTMSPTVKAQQDIEKTLSMLMIRNYFVFIKEKKQYWMTNDSSIPEMINTLRTLIKLELIVVPISTDDVPRFIKAHIKDKKGKDIKDAVNSAIHREKKLTNTDIS